MSRLPETLIVKLVREGRLSADSLPEPYQAIARELGVEAAVRLGVMYQGGSVYFPKLDGVTRQHRDELIRGEAAAGAKVKDLARRYNLSTRHVRQLSQARG